jgi:DNA-binding LacI/PurR family transcriptional regulator
MNASIKDVARHAGVAVSTVSKVINGKSCRPGIAERVNASIAELGYIPNPYARAVRKQASGCLGIMIDSKCKSSSLWFNDLLLALCKTAAEQSYQVHLAYIDSNLDNWELADFSQRVDGVVLIGDFNDFFFQQYNSIFNIPTVNYWYTNPVNNSCILSIAMDNAFIQMLEHLRAADHHSIGAVCAHDKANREKLSILQTLINSMPELKMQLHSEYSTSADNSTAGWDCTEQLLNKHPEITAIFYCSDNYAISGMCYLGKHKIAVPEDISIISFDHTTWAQSHIPRMTAVGFDYDELAQKLLTAILQQEHGKNIEINANFYRNGTTSGAKR